MCLNYVRNRLGSIANMRMFDTKNKITIDIHMIHMDIEYKYTGGIRKISVVSNERMIKRKKKKNEIEIKK